VRTQGIDLPEIRDWAWTGAAGPRTRSPGPLAEPDSA